MHQGSDGPLLPRGRAAAELPELPREIAVAVRGHFADWSEWLARVFALGVQQGSMHLERSPDVESQAFMAAIYGAMLSARAFDDPVRFNVVVDAFIARIRA